MRLFFRSTQRSLMHSAARPLRVGSLRTRLLLLVLGSMLPMVALMLYRAQVDYTRTRTAIQRETLGNAQMVAGDIGQLLAETHDALTRVSRLYLRHLRRNVDIQRELAAMIKPGSPHTNFAVVDTKGAVVVDAIPISQPVTVNDRPWFRDVMRTQQFTVGDYQISRVTGKTILVAALPILDSEKQELKGLATVALDLDQIQVFLKRAVTSEGRLAGAGSTVTSLADRKGTILARYPARGNFIGRTLPDPSLIAGVLSKGEGFAVDRDPDGDTSIYSFVQVKGARGNLYVVTGVPTAAAYADVRQALILNLAWLTLTALFALVVAWSVGTVFILHPIHALNTLADRLTAGDLAARSGVAPGVGELHDLAQSIDRMAQALERRAQEQKLADDELRRSEEKYRGMFELSPEAIVLLDTQGRILDTNDRMHEWLGYERRDIVGKTIAEAEVVAQECYPTLADAFRRRLAGESVPPYELQFVTRNGTLRTGRVIGTPVIDDGVVKGDLVMVSDITEARQAEQQMQTLERRAQQGEKLESLRVMAAGIAHDFNNLLQAIVGNAELAEQALPADAAVQAELREIQRAAVRATRLTHQMLDYAGSGTIHTAVLHLSSFLATRRDTFTAVVSPGVKLEYALATGLPAIMANQGQVEQAVLNLVLNGSEAIGDGGHGTLTVATGRLQVDLEYLHDAALGDGRPEGEYVFVEVSDTGCGIPDAARTRLFEPFFSTKFTGRGLGLASVLGIMRGHKGAIKVWTQPGNGSRFRLLFPALAEAQEKDAIDPRDTAILLANRTSGPAASDLPAVLVVDDEDGLCTMTKHVLARHGFRVFTAGNGRIALELFQREGEQIGLAILDLTMPEMDGIQTCRALKQLAPKLRIVLSSGFAEDQVHSQVDADAFDGFLQKPYTVDTLITTVGRQLRLKPSNPST